MALGVLLGGIGAIVAAAVTVSKSLAVVGLAVEGLKTIGSAISGIAKALGIVKPERKVEDLGDRAMQAEENGMSPEDYQDYQAWVKAIEEDDWGYDPEKNKDMPIEKKILKGVEVSSAVVMEKFPEFPNIADFLTVNEKNVDFFTIERMDEIGKIAETDRDAFGNIVNYVTGTEKDHMIIDATTDVMMDMEKRLSPNMSDADAYTKVASYRKIQ